MKQEEFRPFYKRKRFWGAMFAVLGLMCFIMFLNTQMVSRTERMWVQSEGQLRLINITSSVENNLAQAESYVESYAAQLELVLSEEGAVEDKDLYRFIENQNRILSKKTAGMCFSSYVAHKNKLYIEDFVPDASFHLSERVWYVGAKRNQGSVYITDPYIDANTGGMCYSVSLLLDDGETIVGLDFYMDEIQHYIEKMTEEIDGLSMIVNEGGMIVGHSDSKLVGQDYTVLSDYHELIDKVFNFYGNYFEYATNSGGKYVVFSDKTTYGWYLIVCLPDSSISYGIGKGAIVINLIMLFLCVCFVVSFIRSSRRNVDVEKQLQYSKSFVRDLSTKLKQPVSSIVQQSKIAETVNTDNPEFVRNLTQSAEELSKRLDEIASLQEMSSEEKAEETDIKNQIQNINHRRYAMYIVMILVLAAVMAIGVNTYTQLHYMNARMQIEEENYYGQVQNWIDKNITLTNDLALHLGAQPDLYKDYKKAVKYIDDVVGDNTDISVAYIVNPAWEHAVIMNNGWESDDPSWRVEERDWYVDTVLSNDGFNISTPYQDEQTGMYCVTFSQIVYDERGNIVGLIGVDFYMDTLIDILGASYTREGYAFLTDPSYIILNHPDKDYQMTVDSSVNAGETEYRNALVKESLTFFKDYDDSYKVALVKREPDSGFTVVTVRNAWSIYGTLVLTDAVLLVFFLVSIILIMVITNFMSKLQNKLNHRLQQAADEAVAAGKAKSDFLANMSHEIRTPINAVLGMNEMILRESKDEAILGYANDIQSTGRTLLSIINDILDFSKIESGKMEIVEAKYDVSSVINDLVNLISTRVEPKGLQLKLDIDTGLPETLYGDDVRIRQVITNLLTNAEKYTDTGSVTFTVRRVNENQTFTEGDMIPLYIAVSDTGQGIREEDMEKLFSSFTRINEKKNRTIEGTGLGINITSRLLKMMDSELKVSSVFGEGSTFFFELKQKVISAAPIGDYRTRFLEYSKQQEEQSAKQATAPDVKVLIVDDTQMNLKVEASLLKRTKVRIDTATGGREALELIAEKKYDVIFLDHMMPEMDGVETLQEAKKQDILNGTPVIVLTANAVAGARQNYLDLGFDDYLSKPVKGKEIEGMLFRYIDEARIVWVDKE